VLTIRKPLGLDSLTDIDLIAAATIGRLFAIPSGE